MFPYAHNPGVPYHRAMTKNWKIMPSAPVGFETGLGFSRIQAQLLYNRGIRSSEDADTFMNPDAYASHEPGLLPDIQA